MFYIVFVLALLIPTGIMVWLYNCFEGHMRLVEEKERLRGFDLAGSTDSQFAEIIPKEDDRVLGVRTKTLKIGRFRAEPVSVCGLRPKRRRSLPIRRWRLLPSVPGFIKRAEHHRRALASRIERLRQRWHDAVASRIVHERDPEQRPLPKHLDQLTSCQLDLEVSHGSFAVVIRRQTDRQSARR